MVSSITEGEVKEKEAVVFKGTISSDQVVTKSNWTKINLEYDYIYEQIKPMILEIEKEYIKLRDAKN